MGDTLALEAAGRNVASSRFDPDTRGAQWTVVALVGLLGLTSFAVSFRALHDVAAWAGIGPGVRWAVPVFIDSAILTYALAVLVQRSRGESVWPSLVSLAVFTAMSVAANAAHAVAATRDQCWKTLIGAALAALAPPGVFPATEQMARLVVLRPQDRDLPADVDAIEVSPEQTIDVVPRGEADPEPAPEPESAPVARENGCQESVGAQTADVVEPVVQMAGPAPVDLVAEEETAAAQEKPADDEETSEEEDFAAWVCEQRRLGEPIMGPTAGAFLGMSERTGRDRIKELRSARPELFEEEAA